MSLEHLEVLVEEPSMEALLRAFLPGMLGDATFQVYPYLCKDDLLLRLPERLRGYSRWLPATWRVLVVVDRDDDDCRELKARLDHAAGQARLRTRVVSRIAIEELEAWYFGDWEAVRQAFPRVSPGVAMKERFRDPDGIKDTWEAFEKVLQDAGYFRSGLRKIEAARKIGPLLDTSRNRSASFRSLCSVLETMARG